MKIDPNILSRVTRGKSFARYCLAQRRTNATRKEPSRRLTKEETRYYRATAAAERRHCARLLRAGRQGANPIQAHWFAIGREAPKS